MHEARNEGRDQRGAQGRVNPVLEMGDDPRQEPRQATRSAADIEKFAYPVYDALLGLMAIQARVSAGVPHALDGSRGTIVDYAYALTEEIHETVREIGWKPWQDPREPNTDRVIEEYADILAFLGVLTYNLAKACDMTPEEFAHAVRQRYEKVSLRNLQRFENGREQNGGPDQL